MLSTRYRTVGRPTARALRNLDALACRLVDILVEPREISYIRRAIRNERGCDSIWLGSSQIYHRRSDLREWSGKVEVFRLLDHPEAVQAYAWRRGTGSSYQIVITRSRSRGPLDAVREFGE